MDWLKRAQGVEKEDDVIIVGSTPGSIPLPLFPKLEVNLPSSKVADEQTSRGASSKGKSTPTSPANPSSKELCPRIRSRAMTDLPPPPPAKKGKGTKASGSKVPTMPIHQFSNQLEVQLPIPLTFMESFHCVALFRHMTNSSKRNQAFGFSTKALHNVTGRALIQVDAFLAEAEKRRKEDSTASSQAKNEEIAKALLHISNLETKCKKMEGSFADAQVQVDSLSKFLAKTGEEKASLEKNQAESLVRASQEGYKSGIRACQQGLFRTAAGQAFLKELTEGLVEANKGSGQYLRDLGRTIRHFVRQGASNLAAQMREPSYSGEVNIKALMDNLELPPHLQPLNDLPPGLNTSFPWCKPAQGYLPSALSWIPP